MKSERMPATYTNRKGVTYYLCRGVTKTGKPRYYFAREPHGNPLEQIPAGYIISESVNGIVSLVRARPAQILPDEVAAVESAVRRHPKSRNYRVGIKQNRIEVYERLGPDVGNLAPIFRELGVMGPGLTERLQARLDQNAQFKPEMRFVLVDAEQRVFQAQRMCYRGSIDDFIDLHGELGSIEELARRLVPTLGTDEFFELF
jgi:hypothetical protein